MFFVSRYIVYVTVMVCPSFNSVSGGDDEGSSSGFSKPSTGYYSPIPRSTMETDERIISNVNTCVYKIYHHFEQEKTDKKRVLHAITKLTLKTIKNGDFRSYYKKLAKFVDTGNILAPNEYCGSVLLEPKMFIECLNDLKVFKSTNTDAFNIAYFKYKLSDFTTNFLAKDIPIFKNHRIEYMEHICQHFTLLPNVPTPHDFCHDRYMHKNAELDTTNDETNDGSEVQYY